jgi:hypothetical protein
LLGHFGDASNTELVFEHQFGLFIRKFLIFHLKQPWLPIAHFHIKLSSLGALVSIEVIFADRFYLWRIQILSRQLFHIILVHQSIGTPIIFQRIIRLHVGGGPLHIQKVLLFRHLQRLHIGGVHVLIRYFDLILFSIFAVPVLKKVARGALGGHCEEVIGI